MALNKIYFSNLNPVKFQEQGYANPGKYNTRYVEDFRYQDTLRSFEEPVNFFQHWQTNDIIYLQILTNYGPHQLELYTCQDVLVDTFIFSYIGTSIEGSGLKAYQVSVALDDYDPGNYYFVLKSGTPVLITHYSEVFTLAEYHENTVLLEYTHDENDYDTAFETGIVFGFRIPGGLTELQPASDRTVFIDQPHNITQLSGKSFLIQKLIIGHAQGVPDWLILRVNEIFLCSTVLIDGKQYVANDGASLQASREELYPMTGWSLEVRPAQARSSKRSEVDGDLDNEFLVVNQIDASGFGNNSQPAGSNIIQVEVLNEQ